MEIQNTEKELKNENLQVETVSEKESEGVNMQTDNALQKEQKTELETVNLQVETVLEKEPDVVNVQADNTVNNVSEKNVLIQVPDDKIILINFTDKISNILKNNNYIQDLIKKVAVNIDTSTNVKIGNIITFLNTNIKGVLPLHNILNNLQEVFADGVLDLYDVPTIVKIITELLNSNINSELLRNIKVSDVGLVLKLLIFILLEVKVINIDKLDDKTIFKIIDSSLELLETSLKLSNIKVNCSCFPWCK
jgi:hypothetical protein